jgi:hypothetical protein
LPARDIEEVAERAAASALSAGERRPEACLLDQVAEIAGRRLDALRANAELGRVAGRDEEGQRAIAERLHEELVRRPLVVALLLQVSGIGERSREFLQEEREALRARPLGWVELLLLGRA